MPRAGFLVRFVALFVDHLALGIIAWVLTIIVAPIIGATAATGIPIVSWVAGAFGLVLGFILLFLQFLYFGWLWNANGQSFGMRLVNIKVLRRDGSRVSFLRGGLRGTIGYWISALVFGLGFIWAAFDARKEAWHDKLFDTTVVVA